ncbi:MAG: 2,3-bisphosphoglycerate-independent phosphoglycerate mutase, partial [Gammaproteobacteria bacterium]|nr:2,3-bisphosphoglycerate-independent phosphoglycerate mutase [Gammaproteobacteria bacterium]
MTDRANPLVLIVLDGWGERDGNGTNAIREAQTPNWDRIRAECAHTLIDASGNAVGLPEGQMGNSEVGHMNLGAGRVVYQEFTRINLAVKNGELGENPALQQAIRGNGALHVLGLLSPGGVHSHSDQILALIQLAAEQGKQRIYLHAFLDGRDTPPKSARQTLEQTEALFARLGVGRVASLCGRYFAMDRDHNWDRVVGAYDLLTSGEAAHQAMDSISALDAAYARN